MNMEEMRRKVVESEPGFTISHRGHILCPCDKEIEDDGECPNGHVSPLRSKGMI